MASVKSAKPVWRWNIHPGETLREEYMKPLDVQRKIQTTKLSKALGLDSSWDDCIFIQNCAVVPKYLANRIAVSAVIETDAA